MRFFKFGENGEVLAIVLPSSIQKAVGIKVEQDYEFVELGEGALLLVSRQKLQQLARSSLLGKLGEKILELPPTVESNPQKASSPVRPQGTQSAHPSELLDAQYSPQVQVPVQAEIRPVVNTAELEKKLEKEGFLVLDEEGAKAASVALEMQIKQGNVVGVRAFDKKYYIVSRWFYDSLSVKIRQAMTGKEAGVTEIASLASTSESAATAVLQVMKEKGDAIEKRKGLFKVISE